MCPFLFFILLLPISKAEVLTFEIEDKSVQCFYKTVTPGGKYLLDLQILSGDGFDINFRLYDPHGKIVENLPQINYETITLENTLSGDYKACFDNSFSAAWHKTVFFAWTNYTEDDQSIFTGPDATLLSIGMNIYTNLRKVADYQIKERMLHTISYKFGDHLNSRVMYWSIGQVLVIILVSLGQVLMLRSWFNTPAARRQSIQSRASATGF